MSHLKALASAVRQQSSQERSGTALCRYGLVTSVDPSTYSVKVSFQPFGFTSGWLPVKSQWVGSGWGLVSLPTVNQLVVCDPIEGFKDEWVVSGYVFNDSERPPSSQVGECYLVHASGQYVKLTNDGKLLLNSQTEIDATAPTININSTGSVNVQAGTSANVTAPSISLGAAGQSLKAFVTSLFMSLFNGHTHTSANPGSPTSNPNQQMSSAHLTTTVQGG